MFALGPVELLVVAIVIFGGVCGLLWWMFARQK
jgi:hypothetical protein